MILVVRRLGRKDLGTYSCVCTNSLGHSEATVRVYEIKLATKSPSHHTTHKASTTTFPGRRYHWTETTTNINGQLTQEVHKRSGQTTSRSRYVTNEPSTSKATTNHHINNIINTLEKER
ncbi:uncharacterized protein LOC113389725 [Ctenocephalides felis]|uniref:uncharacterized protein LOC113389725 n=1 Tax=Ctenocephalides felis TaxID=7515 RepID=UPI000E6E45C4|nr:uncharacterized protein LOC113389725 [Ctenocephalides felis]